MQILTKESLGVAVKKCQDSEHYRVLIVTKYAGDHTKILDYLSQVGANVVRCFGHPWARFLNGSTINIISSAYNTRGHKANLVLYQEDIINGNEEMLYVLKAIEIDNMRFNFLKNKELNKVK